MRQPNTAFSDAKDSLSPSKSHLLQSKQPRTLHTKACKRRNILQLTQLRLHTKNGLILACGILFYE